MISDFRLLNARDYTVDKRQWFFHIRNVSKILFMHKINPKLTQEFSYVIHHRTTPNNSIIPLSDPEARNCPSEEKANVVISFKLSLTVDINFLSATFHI